ncbi:FAD-dependent oxidoreductase [Pseudomonadota bacterium]
MTVCMTASGGYDGKGHVVVLGAGVCGLYAALELTTAGVPVTLVEKGEVPGGLAAGFKLGENYYDLGVHMLHGFDQAIRDRVRGLMGEESIEVELDAKIRWFGKDFRYPLQFRDMLSGIPPLELTRCVTGLFVAEMRNRLKRVEPADAEEALIQLYGRPLYDYFFREFTARYWGTGPDRLSASFVKTKMPRLLIRDAVLNAMRKIGLGRERDFGVPSALAAETLYYSRSGAEAMPRFLANAVREAGGEVLLGHEVRGLEVLDDRGECRVTMSSRAGETIRRRGVRCLSTLPLPGLIGILDPAPPADVLDAARRLEYRPIVVYGLLVRKPRAFDALYVYFRDRMFHRVGEPKNAGMKVFPADHTVLIVEMTCDVGDGRWTGDPETIARLRQELEDEGVCSPDEIVEQHILRCAEGYPIFALGFERHLDTLRSYLDGLELLVSTGRQGGFCYPNMHGAMRMGADAAGRILGQLEGAAGHAPAASRAPGTVSGRSAAG